MQSMLHCWYSLLSWEPRFVVRKSYSLFPPTVLTSASPRNIGCSVRLCFFFSFLFLKKLLRVGVWDEMRIPALVFHKGQISTENRKKISMSFKLLPTLWNPIKVLHWKLSCQHSHSDPLIIELSVQLRKNIMYSSYWASRQSVASWEGRSRNAMSWRLKWRMI